jgi:hypothetical protein
MSIQYLLDENLSPGWRKRLLRLDPALIVRRVGEPDSPRLHAPDPEILTWCEARSFILVTRNRISMPQHLADHLAQGNHVPGIFVVVAGRRRVSQLLEDLVLIAGASFENEYLDQIRYLSADLP